MKKYKVDRFGRKGAKSTAVQQCNLCLDRMSTWCNATKNQLKNFAILTLSYFFIALTKKCIIAMNKLLV